jgi:hypothetical protein
VFKFLPYKPPPFQFSAIKVYQNKTFAISTAIDKKDYGQGVGELVVFGV